MYVLPLFGPPSICTRVGVLFMVWERDKRKEWAGKRKRSESTRPMERVASSSDVFCHKVEHADL